MPTVDRSWIEVQQSTFTNWCNDRLKGTETKIEDLVTDLGDGVKLIVLLEQLAKRKLSGRVRYKPRLPVHRTSNLVVAFDFIKEEGIHIVNIGPRDILECNQKLILGLIWTLILKYQILAVGEESHKAAKDIKRHAKSPSAEKLLLNWLQVALPEDQPVINLSSNWNNAQRLSALVNAMKPGSIPSCHLLHTEDALENTERAMDIAESEFGIPKILEAKQLCAGKPDTLSVMTYLSYFCSGEDSPGYKNLMAWVRSVIPEYNVKNLTTDWCDGRTLTALVNALVGDSLPNHASLDPSDGVEKIQAAMKKASSCLEGIKHSITPEEFANEHTCALAMMSYIESLRKAKPIAQHLSSVSSDSPTQMKEEVIGSGGDYPILLQNVDEHPDHLTLFRQYVSNTSEGTERAILEGVGLDTRAIRECFKDNPQDVVQSGLTRWSLGEGFPATWEVLLEAMECARIGQEHIQGLKKNLGQYVIVELLKANLITKEESESLTNFGDVVRLQSGKYHEVAIKSADIIRRQGFVNESRLLAVLAKLGQHDMITTEERKRINSLQDLVGIQSKKSLGVLINTAEVLKRNGFEEESRLLSVRAMHAELQQTGLVSTEENLGMADISSVLQSQSYKSAAVMGESSKLLKRHGLKEEARILSVIVELQQADLLTSEECMPLSDLGDVVRVQQGKPVEVIAGTSEVLKKNGFAKESKLLSVVADLQQANLLTSQSGIILMEPMDVVKVQCHCSPEVVPKSAEVLRGHGFGKVSNILLVLFDLQQDKLITTEEIEVLTDLSKVTEVQRLKSPEVMSATADILKKHGFIQESNLILVQAVVTELHLAGLVTGEDIKKISDLNDVVRVQSARLKSSTKMANSAEILEKHGLTRESRYLKVRAVVVDLQKAGLITEQESKWWRSPSEVVRVQRSKSCDEIEKTANILKRRGFENEGKFLLVLTLLLHDKLITSEECIRVIDLDDVVRVQHGKTLQVLRNTAYNFSVHGFVSKFLSVLIDLQLAHLITSQERMRLTYPTDVAKVQCSKPHPVVVKTAEILEKHNFQKESEFLRILAELQQVDLITDEECGKLCDPSDVVALQFSKSPVEMTKTAVVLRKHGREKEFEFLADAAFLPQKPTMKLVSSLVVPALSSKWKEVGLQLDITPSRIQTIGNRYFMTKEGCGTAMFVQWLHSAPGTGNKQRSWESVLHAVKTGHSMDEEETIRKDLREIAAQTAHQEEDHTAKLPDEEQSQESQTSMASFEEHYSEVISTSASIVLKISKCTTIGPLCNGKNSLKRLLTRQKWGMVEGNASTDTIKVPEWLECYSVEEGGDLWKRVSKEQQLGELVRAINTSPISCDHLRATPHVVPPTSMLSAGPPTTMSSVEPPTTVPDEAPPTALPSSPQHTTALSGFQSLKQSERALDGICNSECIQGFLKDKDGKVLGESHIVHFVGTKGQAVYHEVYPALITSPSVYLVVFNLEDFYLKNPDEWHAHFQSDLIQRPLKSIYTFGMSPLQEKDYLEFHPEAPRIFLVGTHLDRIPQGGNSEASHQSREGFLLALHEMIQMEISSKPYCQFVQYDPNDRSFWAVDNTRAGMEQDDDSTKYISTFRTLVQDRSMETSVRMPLPWLLLRFIMEGKGVFCCKYSELLHEAFIRGYVREDSAETDLDSMLKLFHFLGLMYHKVLGGKKEDSLVFINPDCLCSATSDFLMAAKEEIEASSKEEDIIVPFTDGETDDNQGSNEEDEYGVVTPTKEETHGCEIAEVGARLPALKVRGIVGKQGILQRMKTNNEAIRQEMETIKLTADRVIARIGQEPTEIVLEKLHAQLKEIEEEYKLPTMDGQDASSLKSARQRLLSRLIRSLVNSVEAVRGDLGRKEEAHHVERLITRVFEMAAKECQMRSIDSRYTEQFLAVLSDLRIIAQMNDSYVVPAALPKQSHSVEASRSAASILVTAVSQTIEEACYLPSGLFWCLISEIVTGLGWVVISLERTHVAFAHDSLTGIVHIKECESYIEIDVESEVSPQELFETCQTVRKKIDMSIHSVCTNLYSGPSDSTNFEDMLAWGFCCDVHPADESHIAALQEDDDEWYAECLLQGSGAVQPVTPEQMVWVQDLDM